MGSKGCGAIALLSGVLMALAAEPFHWFGLAWVALAPLWWLCSRADWRSRLAYGALWGIGYYGVALSWITGIHPMTWMGVPWLPSLLIALVCWVLITAWGTAIAIVWAVFWPILTTPINPQNIWSRWLLGITFWCSLEALWQAGPLWWPPLAYTQSPNNLWILHWGQLSGPTTVTALIVGFNGLLAEAAQGFLKPRRVGNAHKEDVPPSQPYQPFLAAALAFLTLAMAGGYRLSQTHTAPGTPFTVGIIQGNVPNEIKLYPAGWKKAIAGYTRGYVELARQGVDVVVTPETSLPYDWEMVVRDRQPFYEAIQTWRVPAWVGAFGTTDGQWTNSLFSISATGQTLSQYDKIKLVPLGEYIPLTRFLGGVIRRLSPLDGQLTPGAIAQTFQTTLGQGIVGICYESAFPQFFRHQAARGGEFIVTVSNDAHYSEAMPAQHHALDVMRAIESDRWAIRATNTGYSAIVDPHGQTVWRSPINEYAIHAAMVERRTSQTLVVRWGDWLLWVLVVGSGVSVMGSAIAFKA